MRAIWLASATATTLKGRRARSCVSQEQTSRDSPGAPQHSDRPDDENAPQVAISLVEIGPNFRRPPSNPAAAPARSRPQTRVSTGIGAGSATVATIAVAPISPMPGIASTCCLAARSSDAASRSAFRSLH